MPMGAYRAERIAERLEEGSDLTVEDMSAMHFDVYSRQAEAFMAHIAPLLPDSASLGLPVVHLTGDFPGGIFPI